MNEEEVERRKIKTKKGRKKGGTGRGSKKTGKANKGNGITIFGRIGYSVSLVNSTFLSKNPVVTLRLARSRSIAKASDTAHKQDKERSTSRQTDGCRH